MCAAADHTVSWALIGAEPAAHYHSRTDSFKLSLITEVALLAGCHPSTQSFQLLLRVHVVGAYRKTAVRRSLSGAPSFLLMSQLQSLKTADSRSSTHSRSCAAASAGTQQQQQHQYNSNPLTSPTSCYVVSQPTWSPLQGPHPRQA